MNFIQWFNEASAEERRRGDLGAFQDFEVEGGPGGGGRMVFERGQVVLAPSSVDDHAGTLADSLAVICETE
jgi:hypothetical protein